MGCCLSVLLAFIAAAVVVSFFFRLAAWPSREFRIYLFFARPTERLTNPPSQVTGRWGTKQVFGMALMSELLGVKGKGERMHITLKCTKGKTAELAVFNEFNHIIEKRIISELRHSELPCGK